jgi:hypothetical protein
MFSATASTTAGRTRNAIWRPTFKRWAPACKYFAVKQDLTGKYQQTGVTREVNVTPTPREYGLGLTRTVIS